ncbi:MAG: hemerythrin domain-containing protein [Methanomassiliicoccales archaeon]|nr:hemerythrin domain-containing protein [Methanomassiliicoccales archaeon]
MRVSVTLLQYEHGIIRQVIDVLGDMVKHNSMKKHQNQMKHVVKFLDEYLDKYHHGKEEKLLFPMAAKRLKDLIPEIARLVTEHAEARANIAKMKAMIATESAYSDGSLAAMSKVLVDSMIRHIRHEEDVVYPKIEDALSMDDDIKLLKRYDRFNADFDPDFARLGEEFAVRVQDDVLGPGFFTGIS